MHRLKHSIQRIGSHRPLDLCISRYGMKIHSIAASARGPIPHIEAPHIEYATRSGHVRDIATQLRKTGILKISIGFADDSSRYLTRLLTGLHEHHGHRLPISHSAMRGWFWDIRPSDVDFQAGNHQARSETMQDFPWHTDCSYEDLTPRYFALQVIQPDKCGGGTLSLMNVQNMSELLSPATRAALGRLEYRIDIPPEFIKSQDQRHIVGNILATDGSHGSSIMRFREDIVTPLSEDASQALYELKRVLSEAEMQPHSTILRLRPSDMPRGSIILVDNRRWLHARSDVKDPKRHLRRVRWDAVPFQETFV